MGRTLSPQQRRAIKIGAILTVPMSPHLSSRAIVTLSCILLIIILAVLAWEKFGITQFAATAPLSASSTQAYLQEAQNAYNNNDFTSAIGSVDAILTKNPNDVSALVSEANILAQEGSLSFNEKEYGTQAIAVAQQALTIDPNSADAWRVIGYANEIMQNYPAAENAYQKSLAIDPNNALTLSQQAHSYDLQGDTARAEAGYKAALAIDPTLDQAQMGLARIYIDQQELSQALGLFENVATSSANVRIRAEAEFSAGELYLARNDLGPAQQLMNSSTSLDPSYPLGWVGDGLVDFSEAVATTSGMTDAQRNALITSSFQSLQKAVTLNPYQSAAYYQIGVEFGTVGQYALATKFLDEAVTVVPNDITLSVPEKQVMLARIHSALSVLSAH